MLTAFTESDQKLYELMGDEKYAGFVDFSVPDIYVKDLDLIKRVLVKDFDHFVDRPTVEFSKVDEV